MIPTVPLADLEDAFLRNADAVAVLNDFVFGRPLDPAAVHRVRAKAERVTDDVRRARGLENDDTFQSLLEEA